MYSDGIIETIPSTDKLILTKTDKTDIIVTGFPFQLGMKFPRPLRYLEGILGLD
jgi:hypothetical protein